MPRTLFASISPEEGLANHFERKGLNASICEFGGHWNEKRRRRSSDNASFVNSGALKKR
jgi:hypothetical protein